MCDSLKGAALENSRSFNKKYESSNMKLNQTGFEKGAAFEVLSSYKVDVKQAISNKTSIKGQITIKDIMSAHSHLPGESTKLDVDLILSHTLHCDRPHLYTYPDQKLNSKQMQKVKSLLKLRAKGWPIAYLLKEKEFYGRKFYVEPGVFIPRPETETIVSAVLNQMDRKPIFFEKSKKKGTTWKNSPTCNKDFNKTRVYIMDFGCGTGCIGLSLLAQIPEAFLIGIDTNKQAIQVSQINAQNLGLSDRALFIQQDLTNFNSWSLADVIVANPPYIAFEDQRVQKEVRQFEPAEALFSKQGGLAHIQAWLKTAHACLKPGGAYFFEIGANQDLSSLESQMCKKEEFKDLSGWTRVLKFQKI